jgi:hypothetical protein
MVIGPIDTIPGVPKPRKNIASVIQRVIDLRYYNANVWVL